LPEVPIRSFTVSVVALRKRDDKHQVLLLKRAQSLSGEWCQIAGKIEKDERAWQAALRELAEETRLRPTILYSADICEQFYEPSRDAITVVPVFVACVEPDKNVVLNDEHSEFRWVSFDEAVEMVPFAEQRRVLGHIEREFIQRPPSRNLKIDLG
jgi:dATP pyrophosphohydrolase